MRIARFSTGSAPRPGLVVDGGIVDLSRHLPSEAAADIVSLMAAWTDVAGQIAELKDRQPDYPLSAVRLEAPIARPGKIFALGLNYADHCAEGGLPVPEQQTWFAKAPSAINGPYDPIEVPAVSDQLDYEAELVVVIGRRVRNLRVEDAPKAIFGYCVGNDVSVRDWQLATPQWSLGKSFDKAAPVGPWITTADAVDPHNLAIRALVNGEVRQDSNTHHFVFNAYDMVAHLSQAMTLEPGDLIFTGTPSGVGLHQPGGANFLKAGDVVRVEIEHLGHIENIVERGSGATTIL